MGVTVLIKGKPLVELAQLLQHRPCFIWQQEADCCVENHVYRHSSEMELQGASSDSEARRDTSAPSDSLLSTWLSDTRVIFFNLESTLQGH